jgi:hypothetical protein
MTINNVIVNCAIGKHTYKNSKRNLVTEFFINIESVQERSSDSGQGDDETGMNKISLLLPHSVNVCGNRFEFQLPQHTQTAVLAVNCLPPAVEGGW